MKAIQRIAGARSAAMTLDLYADLFDDDLDAVEVPLEEMWAPEANVPSGS